MAATVGSSASATQYDVFLSSRGPDTRDTFTDCLYRDMVGQGIVAYRDSEELHAGDRIDDLLRAVGLSKFCVTLFSSGNASSAWCLRELARIMGLDEAQGELIELENNILRELKGSFKVGQTSGVDDRSVRRRITSWKKGKLLGKGSFGEVYQALTNDGFSFAVKEVSLVDEGCKKSLLHLEQDDVKIYLFLELMTEGSLAMLYDKYNLSDSEVSAYTRQMLNGLKYLHDQNVSDSQVSAYTRQMLNGLKYLHDHRAVHRDIKCANILVDVSGSVKLADFGLAKAIEKNDANSFKGSPYWMAPEVVVPNDRCYGLPADIWSLGCTVLEMFIRKPPYHPLTGEQALFKIFQGELPPLPPSLSRDARDFILRCLQVDPNKRGLLQRSCWTMLL